MQQNRLIRPLRQQISVCLVCHSVNAAGSRFCGKCGALAKPEFPFRSGSAEERAITEPQRTSGPKIVDISTKRTFERKTKKHKGLARLLHKFSVKQRKAMAKFLFAIILVLSGLLIIGNTGVDKPATSARWGDFRTFLARSLELSHQELDSIFSQALNLPPMATTMVNRFQSELIEATLRKIFQQPDLEIFPNPFFEAPSNEFSLEQGIEGVRFADVPLSHPVYTALRPLHEIGLNCADQNNRIRPYEKTSWDDWSQTTGKLLRILALESAMDFEREPSRGRFMSNIELRNYLEHLREKLYIKETQPLIYGHTEFYPSRLEAFSALAAILKELESPS